MDSLHQSIGNELVEPIEVIKPFEISQKARNLQTDDIGNIISNEEFLVHFQIKSNSKCPLQIDCVKVNNTVNINKLMECDKVALTT